MQLEKWKVAAGDPTAVFVGNAKPIYCGSQARAKLVAAAPALLAALSEVVRNWDGEPEDMAAANAAIAKAI